MKKNRSLSHTYALVMAAAAAYKWIHKFLYNSIVEAWKIFCLKIFNIENWNFVCECSLWHHFSDINFMPFFSHCIFVLFQLLRSFYVCLLHIALCQIEAGIVSDAAGGNWKQFFFSDGKINFRCWPTNRIILCLCVYINSVANHLWEITQKQE